MKQGIVNGGVFDGTGLHQGLGVVIEDGRIAEVTDEESVAKTADSILDLGGNTLAPGYVDLQVTRTWCRGAMEAYA